MTSTSTTSRGRNWLARNGWILAGVWLVFLIFPLLAILGDDSTTTEAKIASTVLIVAFAAVYLDGFRRQHRREHEALLDLEAPAGYWTGAHAAGLAHFVGLVALTAALFFVAGLGALGVIAFIVVFAVFIFPWPAVWAAFVGGIVVTAGVPLLAGRLTDLWFLSLIVASVGGAAVMVRALESYQFDQSHLRTQLAISDERTRVARDVHDVLGHSITAVILKVELCQRLLEQADQEDGTISQERLEACRKQLAELETIGRSALAEVRSTVGGLRAANLADEVTAARTVLADAGVDLLVTGDAADIPDRHRATLAWVVREAVTNIVRHARAERCHIELAPAPDAILLRVTDDGVGLNPGADGNGLRGIRERVTAFGGELRVESAAPSSQGDTVNPQGDTVPTGTRIEVAI